MVEIPPGISQWIQDGDVAIDQHGHAQRSHHVAGQTHWLPVGTEHFVVGREAHQLKLLGFDVPLTPKDLAV